MVVSTSLGDKSVLAQSQRRLPVILKQPSTFHIFLPILGHERRGPKRRAAHEGVAHVALRREIFFCGIELVVQRVDLVIAEHPCEGVEGNA